MALAETLDNVRVLIHSAIRIQSDDGTVIYCDPYDLVEEPHDAGVVFITHGIMTICLLKIMFALQKQKRLWLLLLP